MRHINIGIVIIPALVCIWLLTGCNTQSSQAATDGAAPSAPATAAASSEAGKPSAPAETDASQSSPAQNQQEAQPKEAAWVIDINDTTQYTDEIGVIWNYTLTFHASKPGGKDATGEYAGEALLTIEPDFASVQAAAAREGTQLLSLVFNFRAECGNLSFIVEKDNPDLGEDDELAPLVDTDFSAASSASFNSTQEPVAGTIMTDEGPFSAAGGGGGGTVNVPFKVDINGASAYVTFESLPQPLLYAFKGVITGDVLPG